MIKKRKTKSQCLEIMYQKYFRHPRRCVHKKTGSVKGIAEFIGIHQSVLTKILNGKSYTCSHRHCLIFAAALGIGINELPLDEKMLTRLKAIRAKIKNHVKDNENCNKKQEQEPKWQGFEAFHNKINILPIKSGFPSVWMVG